MAGISQWASAEPLHVLRVSANLAQKWVMRGSAEAFLQEKPKMAKSKPIAILMFQPNPASMCSREIADITGKPHDEVLQDIRDTLEVPVEPEYHLEEKLALFLVTGEGYGSAYGRRGWAEIHARFLEIGAGSVKPLDAETFVRAATMARASAIPKIVEALNAAAEDDPFMSQVLREAAQELGWVDEDPIEP